MREKLEEVLRGIRPDIELEGMSFVDDGVLDSFDIVTLVSELIDAFGIELSVEDILPVFSGSIGGVFGQLEYTSSYLNSIASSTYSLRANGITINIGTLINYGNVKEVK